MRIDIVSIFPEMFRGPLGSSIMGRAQERGLLQLMIHDLRDHAHDRHRSVDDYPYGGGSGMVMRPEPFFTAMDAITRGAGTDERPHIILLSPAGRRLEQAGVRRLASRPWLVLLCGHYEGVDERVITGLGAEPWSVGDFVLTGGELPAMAIVDAVVRLLPGVLGASESLLEESFAGGLLEYPHYTRPAHYRGMSVPDVLTSGDHAAIAAWRRRTAIERTAAIRPDLLAKADLSPQELAFLRSLSGLP